MSQNSLSLYASTDSVSALEKVGLAIAKSGIMRGCDTAEKGMMFAMTAAARGVDILSLAQRYEFISGRLSMPSKVMLAEFRARGGDYEMLERSGDVAAIKLIYKGRESTFRFTWDEAKGEPFIYNGKESELLRFIQADNQKLLAEKLKPKYATPRARMQMLWARVVSDAVGTICPEVNIGVYTPEEIDDFDESSSASSPTVAVESVPTKPSVSVADDIIDAEFTPNPDAHCEPFLATAEQIKRMTELFKLLGMDAAVQMKAFKSVKADSMASVTDAGARELIEKMEGRLNAMAPEPPPVPESAILADDSPATADQIDSIRTLIESVSQREGMAGIPGRIKEHLNSNGVAKFGHLTSASAQSLIDSLNGTAGLDDFFDVPPRSIVVGQ